MLCTFTRVLLTEYPFQAFVIYNFFHLLLAYLGGERSLLILLHGRPPKDHLFPGKYFFGFRYQAYTFCQSTSSSARWTPPIHSPFFRSSAAYYVCHELPALCDPSELSVEYVQVKPILAAVTLILKATGKYGDGDFRSDKGYLYVTVVYNISICVALYCLAMFWVVINDDVKPFRPMPKFLCIKGMRSLLLQ